MVQRGEDVLLAPLQGTWRILFWNRGTEVKPGEVARLGRGKITLRTPQGGKALLVVLGLSSKGIAQDHERLLALLEALPAQGAVETLVQAFEAHIAKEEALYYPTLSPGKLKERLLEHRILRELLAELLKALRQGRSTGGIVQRLKTAFQAHSEAELEG